MGKWIDRAVLTAFIAAALYLLFLSAFGSVLASAGMSFTCCALLIHARRKKPQRMTRQQAKTLLECWAYGPDDEAKRRIESLTDLSDAKLIYLPKHPTAVLSTSDVFSAWKAGRGEQKLVLAAPCHTDGRARTFAHTLQHPDVTILDSSRLIPLIRKSGLTASGTPHPRYRLHRLCTLMAELPRRRPWYKSLASGAVLMLLYLFSGSVSYLFLATAMLFISGVSLRARP